MVLHSVYPRQNLRPMVFREKVKNFLNVLSYMFPYVRIYRFEKGNERRKPQRSDTGRIGVRKNDGRKNLSSS